MKTYLRLHLALSLVLGLGAMLPGIGPAQAGTLTEDFSTTTLHDAGNTTADWNTGAQELRLFPFGLTQVGSWNTTNRAEGVLVHGNLLLVSDFNDGLLILDITDPTSPDSLGRLDTDRTYDVTASGNLAFVADLFPGMRVVDISDPTLPVQVGIVDTPARATGVAVAGDIAAVADREGGLQIVDISDPTTPAIVGNFPTLNSWGVEIRGHLAYVADETQGLVVLDISDPTSPDSLGAFATTALEVDVDGSLAYVAARNAGLQIMDVTDPTNPTLLGSITFGNLAWDVSVSGDRVLVGHDGTGASLVDVSDPANPVLIDTYNTPDWAVGVDMAGEYGFVGDRFTGVLVLQTAFANPPIVSGGYNTPGNANGLAAAGDVAVVTDNGTVRLLDISDPDAPLPLGTYASSASDVSLYGGLALLSGLSDVEVLDISDPNAPSLTATIPTAGIARQTLAEGGTLYVADLGSGLRIYDISEPGAPAQAGSLMVSTDMANLALAGDYLFVGAGFSGIYVVDVSDPTAPSLVTNFGSVGGNLHIDGQHLFSTGSTGFGFRVYDITDPATPVQIGSWGAFDPSGSARMDLVTDGDFAYVAVSDSGIAVVDITDLTAPVLVGIADTPGLNGSSNNQVAVAGHRVFKADGAAGVQVFRVLQDEVNAPLNAGRSLAVDTLSDTILSARLSATEAPGVAWELSGDGGANWQAVANDNSWNDIAAQGADLLWRTTHTWLGQNPAVQDVTLQWLYEFGGITSIEDVPADQGGRVYLEFLRSHYDDPGEATNPVTQYGVYRRVDAAALAPEALSLSAVSPRVDGTDDAAPLPGVEAHWIDGVRYVTAAAGIFPPGTWALVASVPATQSDTYLVEVTTEADSSDTGTNESIYLITTHTTTPSTWFASEPDSGYSVDNIAPGVPEGFAAVYEGGGTAALSWEPAPEEDFQYFRVYRGATPGFGIAPELIVHETAGTDWEDPAPGDPNNAYYRITALDHVGNESEPTASGSILAADDRPARPAACVLSAAVPNPMRSGTRIAFQLPADAPVSLSVFDVTGRLVRTLVDETRPAGAHTVTWDGTDRNGTRVSAGVYLYRLRAGAFTRTQRLVVTR